ncbi:hypothetical protein [Sulfuricurvum sp.]|uniref:hypothetical protein n=1 Tax=Sulfuricurvum sp. TaxID=2025608 RepID=UPI002617AC80|nr:hypothetical protein [Sulfuricurvum sp.]MDD2780500.1 hypothetical protein [Sulfuricurvum sp.]
MAYDFKDSLGIASDCATIAAFGWAVYEFYYKRHFKIKAIGTPSPVNSKPTECFLNFEVINLSEQSLKRIDFIGIWIKRWNSFGQFWEIPLQDVGYQEKTKFSQDIFRFLDSAIEQCVKEQTLFDSLFKPKLKIVLRTTLERELEVKINKYYKNALEEKVYQLFEKYEKKAKCEQSELK